MLAAVGDCAGAVDGVHASKTTKHQLTRVTLYLTTRANSWPGWRQPGCAEGWDAPKQTTLALLQA